jgi:ubiquinone/menaquinone biosynthesis C-methylase UbiE
MGIRAHFSVASFLELPFASASFDFVLLTDVMYSAIPDASARQTWLTGLRHVLKPNGRVILSFASEREHAPRLKLICSLLNAVLVKLPGANKAYRRGDAYAYGHFMHFFQNEDEIRNELLGARVTIQELNWAHRFAVVTHSPSHNPSS